MEAKRIVEPPEDPSTNVTVVEGQRLRSVKAKGLGLGAMLDSIAGARVLDLGGPVSDARLTVRGGAPGQASVIIDGVQLSAPFATGADVNQIPLESIERVELIRGGQGAVLGDGALTGALRVFTRRPGDKPKEAASLTAGSFGLVRVAAAASRAPVSLSASYERTSGQFDYASSIFGLPDSPQVRDNNDAQRGALTFGLEKALGRYQLKLRSGGSFREAGVPGLEQQENQLAREQRGQGYLRAALSRKFAKGTGSIQLGANAAHLYIGYRDPAPERRTSSRTHFTALSADAKGELALGLYHFLRLDARLGGELSDSTEHGQPSRLRISVGLSDEISLGALVLFAAGRLVSISDQPIALLPRVGLRYEPWRAWTFTVSAGRSLRSPTIDELYHPIEAGFQGNPSLISETAWEGELTARFDAPLILQDTLTSSSSSSSSSGRVRDRLTAQLGVFARRIDDTILYINRNAFVIRPENLGAASAAGGELELGYRLRSGALFAGVQGALSLLFSRLDETGDPLPTQPRLSGFGQLSGGYGPVELSTGLRYFSATNTRLRAAEANQVAPYLRWDLGLTATPWDGVSASFQVLNVLDDRTLQSVNQIPLPGRTFLVSLRLNLAEST